MQVFKANNTYKIDQCNSIKWCVKWYMTIYAFSVSRGVGFFFVCEHRYLSPLLLSVVF